MKLLFGLKKLWYNKTVRMERVPGGQKQTVSAGKVCLSVDRTDSRGHRTCTHGKSAAKSVT